MADNVPTAQRVLLLTVRRACLMIAAAIGVYLGLKGEATAEE